MRANSAASRSLSESRSPASQSKPPMMASKRPIGTARSHGSLRGAASTAAMASAMSPPCASIEYPASGPPRFQIGSPVAEFRAGSATQSTIAAAKSASAMGLHVAERPPPRSKYTNGAPVWTFSTCPDTDLKNAVGRTTEYVTSDCAASAASVASLAFWNSSSGFCTQNADRRTKCRPCPLARSASRQLTEAWLSTAHESALVPDLDARQQMTTCASLSAAAIVSESTASASTMSASPSHSPDVSRAFAASRTTAVVGYPRRVHSRAT
mmetsp:Transcript_8281/g.34107  ORF Transcript_8281/g.34107 Transcript_8281/m.34107 type:complete len:268 (-) Transcript_8281:235-1038(-)